VIDQKKEEDPRLWGLGKESADNILSITCKETKMGLCG
jgi:hypothetical protein